MSREAFSSLALIQKNWKMMDFEDSNYDKYTWDKSGTFPSKRVINDLNEMVINEDYRLLLHFIFYNYSMCCFLK